MMFYKETRFKNTEVGRIPEDWKVVRLGDIAHFESGKRPKGGAKSEGEVLSIGGEHINDSGYLDLTNPKFIPISFYKSLRQGILRDGDVIMCKDGAKTGKVAYIRELRSSYAAANEHVFVIRGKNLEMANNEFIFYVLFSSVGQNQVKAVFHGMVGGITGRELYSFRVPLPPIEEQKKIAEILSTVDKAIEKTDEIIAKTKRLKKGLMQELLSGRVRVKVENSKVSFYRETRFKDIEIGKIPTEWEIVKLEDIAKVFDCKHRTPKYYSEGIPVLLPRNVREGYISLEDAPRTSYEEYLDLTEKYKPAKGDIIYTRNAKVGIAGIVSTDEKFALGQDLIGIRPLKKIDSYYLLYVLTSSIIKEYLIKVQTGSTFKRINLSLIRKFKIPLPPLEEQQKIAEILGMVDKKLEIEKKEKERLERIKKGLMDVLLTGKVRVKA